MPSASGPPSRATPASIHPQGRWVLLVTIVGSALVIIDVTAMNVIAPAIQDDLGTDVGGVQWVIESYTLFLASVMLVGGALADRFGRRRIFGLGIILFSAASLACALAPDVTSLIAARGAQGLGGALMMPGSLALIGAHFPKHARGRAIGIWGGMSGLTAVLGPVLGGILSDLGSWRWIFFVNVPIGALLLIPLATRVPESRRERQGGHVDVLGALLATAGLGGITYGLIQAGLAGWTHATTTAGLAGGATLFAVFLAREARATDPMLPLRLFGDRDFAGANVLTLFVYAALAAGMFFVPMRLIFLDGYSPTRAGLAMVPTILLISALSPRMGALTDRIGARRLLTTGPLIAAAGFFLLAVPGHEDPYVGGILWGLILVGLGMAVIIAPLTATVLDSVPEEDVGTASGINNAVSRLAALLAIAISGVIALGVFSHWLAADLEDLGLDADARDAAWAQRTDLAAADPPGGLDPTDQARLERAYDGAFLAAYRGVQAAMGVSALVGAAAAWAMLRPKSDAST